MQGVTALLFDLDNTLFNRDQAVHRWAEDFTRTHLDIPLSEPDAHADAIVRVIALDAHGYGAKPSMFAALKSQYAALTAHIEDLVDAFYRQVPTYAILDDGAARLLAALDHAHVPFGIVTNGSRYQIHTVTALGLDHRTSCILVSELVGCRKPDPTIFAMAAACLKTLPGSILFVGDNPEADIEGAYSAGMWTAWLRQGQTWPTAIAPELAGLVIDSLDELVSSVGREIISGGPPSL